LISPETKRKASRMDYGERGNMRETADCNKDVDVTSDKLLVKF